MSRAPDPGQPEPLVEPLSQREIEILALIADHLSKQEIAEKLGLAYSTVKWYTQQTYQKLGVHGRRQAMLRAQELGLLGSAPAPPESAPANLLPAQLTPFLGRQVELDQVCQLLRSPECRLLTILGPGGIGKTRLALQSAERLLQERQPAFPDGVYFIPLAGLSESRSILPAMLAQLNFSSSDRRQPIEKQLLHFLRPQRALLIFDNFEHLLDRDSLQLLKEILQAAPQVSLLITSRARVNLAGEHVFPLSGLEVPKPEALRQPVEIAQAASYSSLKLFTQSARRLAPDFALNAHNLQPVSQICERLDGMPLAIELAAAWIRVLDPAEILARLEQSYHFLEPEGCSSADGSANLCRIFQTSWQQLSTGEQLAMQQLAVFRGSFSRQMAQQVAQVSLQQLLALVDQSWLQHTAGGRFQIHELLRQYAAEQLEQNPLTWQAAHQRYSDGFCDLLQQRADDWHGPLQLEALKEVHTEIHHIESAWRWKVAYAVDRADWGQMERALNSLCSYYEWTGRARDGETACKTLAHQLAQAGRPPDLPTWDSTGLQALALAWQSAFSDDPTAALQLLEQSQALAEQLPPPGARAHPAQPSPHSRQALLAFIFRLRGERQVAADRRLARRTLARSRELYTMLGDEWGEAKVSAALGDAAWAVGAYAHARRLLIDSLAVHQRLGDRREAVLGMDTLGLVEKHLGAVEEAERLQREALALGQALGASGDEVALTIDLAHTLVTRGKYDEAIELVQGIIARQEGPGLFYPNLAEAHNVLAHAALHQGDYARVYAAADRTIAIGQKYHAHQSIGFAHLFAGLARTAESRVPQALQQFEHSLACFQRLQQNIFTIAHMGLGLAYLKDGQVELARRHLLENLKVSRRRHAFLPLILSVPALVLLFSLQADYALAGQLSALAQADPMLQRSRWLSDLVGSAGTPGGTATGGDFWQVMAEAQRALVR